MIFVAICRRSYSFFRLGHGCCDAPGNLGGGHTAHNRSRRLTDGRLGAERGQYSPERRFSRHADLWPAVGAFTTV